MKLTPALRSTLITFASFILVITAVSAWDGPSVSAPNGNVSAPLTISAISQSKEGGLDVGWLSAVGAVKVGYTATACSVELAGSLRWNTGVMEYCDGIDTWRSFGGSSTGGGSENSCLTGTGLLTAYVGKSASHTAVDGSSNTTATISVNSGGTAVTCSGDYGSATLTATNISNGVNSSTGPSGLTSITYSFSAGFVCNATSNSAVSGVTLSSRVILPSYGDILINGNYLYSGSKSWYTNLGEGVIDSGSADLASGVSALPGGGVKDKCLSSGGSVAETDPTVLPSVKDGVSWSEVTGKPTALKGEVIAGCARSGGCWGGSWSPQDVSMHCPAGSTGHSMYQTTDIYGPGYHSYFCVQD